MDNVAVAERVSLSREEYETLRAGQPATVTIDAAEYARLKAAQSPGIDPALHQRVVGRLAEVEQLLRRELQDHQAEISEMTKKLEHK